MQDDLFVPNYLINQLGKLCWNMLSRPGVFEVQCISTQDISLLYEIDIKALFSEAGIACRQYVRKT